MYTHTLAHICTCIFFTLFSFLFSHQNVSGYYRVSAYFLAKFLCDVIPLRIFSVIFFAAITYWMIGIVYIIKKNFGKFGKLILIIANSLPFQFSINICCKKLANLFTNILCIVIAKVLATPRILH